MPELAEECRRTIDLAAARFAAILVGAHQKRLTAEAVSRHAEAMEHFRNVILPQSRRLRGE